MALVYISIKRYDLYGKKLYVNCELSKVYQNSLINADINISCLLNGKTHRIEKKHNKLGEVQKNIRADLVSSLPWVFVFLHRQLKTEIMTGPAKCKPVIIFFKLGFNCLFCIHHHNIIS